MALFEQGNKNYLFRLTDGKFKAYSVDEWALKLAEYFEFMANDYWERLEPIKSGDQAGTTMTVKMRTPLSRKSLCIFAKISEDTLRNYASNKESYVDYFDLTKHALDIIDNNQIEGALLNQFNAGIVSRLQGLVDKTDLTSDGDKINQVPSVNLNINSGGKKFASSEDEVNVEK